jgi:hypothetical protein
MWIFWSNEVVTFKCDFIGYTKLFVNILNKNIYYDFLQYASEIKQGHLLNLSISVSRGKEIN